MRAAPSGTALSFIRKRECGSVLLNNYYIPGQACPACIAFTPTWSHTAGRGRLCVWWLIATKFVAHCGPMLANDNYKAARYYSKSNQSHSQKNDARITVHSDLSLILIGSFIIVLDKNNKRIKEKIIYRINFFISYNF